MRNISLASCVQGGYGSRRSLLVLAIFTFGFVSQISAQGSGRTAEGLSVTGEYRPNLVALDEMMGSFMREHKVPGASLAVSKDGVLVYSRGFGLRDVRQELPVMPSTRFRIASLSKPITSAAIAALVKSGKMTFDDPLVSFLDAKERSLLHPQLRSVTIKQILLHRGGWDRSISGDPMFETVKIGKALRLGRPANQAELIQFVLQRAPDFEPGAKYAYSNFGYCLLGRVIERVSKQPYGEFVKGALFKVSSETSLDLGKTLTAQTNESRYYVPSQRRVTGVVTGVIGKQVPTQYGGWCIENMDSHGGWIASAEDLVAFANSFNQPESSVFLTKTIASEVFQNPLGDDKDVFYGYGWLVRRVGSGHRLNTWHNGSLPGTSTLLVRRHDGFNWAVLFNSRDGSDGKSLSTLIDPLIHQAVNRVEKWPE
ncbi:MAG: beta-lactamase family protein [Planctomycetaceae bacterium]|nr:beta-lactamase family protein [Planctomycetaceae bacterium]